MDSVKLLRRILMLLTVVALLAVLLILFQLGDFGYRAFVQLKENAPALLVIYLIAVIAVALLGLVMLYKIATVGRGKAAIKSRVRPSLDRLQARLAQARAQGIAVDDISAEIDALPPEDSPQELEVAFFGKISTGKSSLIKSLIPEAQVETSVIGGSTAKIERYSYQADNGLRLQLLDMPGTHQAEQLDHLDAEVLTTARRAHIVCYVLDQDMTASDKAALQQLSAFDKPLVVVLNKIKRYSEAERQQLVAHIESELPQGAQLVQTDSIHSQLVTITGKDGSTRQEERLLGGEVRELLRAFAALEQRRGELSARQRQALIELADETLSQHMATFRRTRGLEMVKSYARKAMFGGVAAVGPGTDVIIQGYLGMEMLKALTKLYGISTKEVDLQALLDAVGGKIKSHLTVVLALTGNVCKAFPGIGTVLGGASHAIAYGLIFESLGRALVETLANNDAELNSQSVLNQLENQMQQDMEKRAIDLIKMALSHKSEA